MPLQVATLFGAAMALGGALILGLGLRHVWRAGSVLRAPGPGDPEADAAAIVRLDGTVTAPGDEGTVEAPFSGAESVVERHVVEERQFNPTVPILPWDATIEEGTASAPFELRTPEATATVDGAIGSAILGRETIAIVDAGETPPERIAAFHEETGLATEPLIFGSLPGPLAGIGRALGFGRRTYGEERLDVGDDVTVVGHPVGRPQIDGDAGDAEAGGVGTVDPLVVSDRSPRRAFLSMAKTGLVAGVLGIGVLAIGLVVLLLG